jgi:cytochrome bd-type quinol oxidase subunit 2
MSTATLSSTEHPRALTFLRHLGAMTLAMFLGMFGFGFALGLIASTAGTSLERLRVSQPELFMLGMASAMSMTMIAWMRHRRHTWRECVEMTAAMFVPVLGVLACYWASAITADPVCPLSCVLMVPAMAAAMILRRNVYTAAHAHAEMRVMRGG